MPDGHISSFSEKLGWSLDILGHSNAVVAKLLNIDPSYVSRMRCGMRIPKPNSELMSLVCDKLGRRLWDQGLVEKTVRRMEPEGASLQTPYTQEGFLAAYRSWMSSNEHGLDMAATVEIVGSIQKCSEMLRLRDGTLPDVPKLLSGIAGKASRRTYFGRQGLSEAVLRLFYGAHTKPVGRLDIYSDQGISWTSVDHEVGVALQGIVAGCLLAGVSIRVVHFLSRDDDELIEGLKLWIPLYFLGEVESRYLTKDPGQAFCHTLMSHRGHAAVAGTCLRGSEDSGSYRYITAKSELVQHDALFDQLVETSRPFVSSAIEHDQVKRIAQRSGESMILSLSSLPAETLAADDLAAMLARTAADQGEIDSALVRHRRARQRLERLLADNDVALLLHADGKSNPRIIADDRLFGAVAGLAYRNGEWEEHLRDTIEFFSSRGAPVDRTTDGFTGHMDVMALKDCVIISMADLSQKSFVISQESTVRAMGRLLGMLGEGCPLP